VTLLLHTWSEWAGEQAGRRAGGQAGRRAGRQGGAATAAAVAAALCNSPPHSEHLTRGAVANTWNFIGGFEAVPGSEVEPEGGRAGWGVERVMFGSSVFSVFYVVTSFAATRDIKRFHGANATVSVALPDFFFFFSK